MLLNICPQKTQFIKNSFADFAVNKKTTALSQVPVLTKRGKYANIYYMLIKLYSMSNA